MNIFRVTGHLCGEFTGPGEFRAQRPMTRSFDVSLIYAWINDWVHNREAGDLRRHRGNCDVNVTSTRIHTRTSATILAPNNLKQIAPFSHIIFSLVIDAIFWYGARQVCMLKTMGVLIFEKVTYRVTQESWYSGAMSMQFSATNQLPSGWRKQASVVLHGFLIYQNASNITRTDAQYFNYQVTLHS